MKKIHQLIYLLPVLGLFYLTGCSNVKPTMKLNSIQLTNQLHQGMSYAEVETLLGKPKSVHSNGTQMIARWNLQEMWKGYIPYDMVFNAADKTLISWSENGEAFQQQQDKLKLIADEMTAIDQSGGGNSPSAMFENDPSLMQYFQGAYYHFSSSSVGTGGTESEISLCPNGRYYSSSESGYSGNAGTAGAWGNASQNGDSGTWKITGSKTEGTIAMTGNNGKTTTYKYSVCGDGCIYFGSTKYGYNGSPKCR